MACIIWFQNFSWLWMPGMNACAMQQNNQWGCDRFSYLMSDVHFPWIVLSVPVEQGLHLAILFWWCLAPLSQKPLLQKTARWSSLLLGLLSRYELLRVLALNSLSSSELFSNLSMKWSICSLLKQFQVGSGKAVPNLCSFCWYARLENTWSNWCAFFFFTSVHLFTYVYHWSNKTISVRGRIQFTCQDFLF